MGHGGTDLSFGSVRRKANVVRLTCILTQGDDDGNLLGDHHDVVHSHYFHSIVIHNPTTPDSAPDGGYTGRTVHRTLDWTVHRTDSTPHGGYTGPSFPPFSPQSLPIEIDNHVSNGNHQVTRKETHGWVRFMTRNGHISGGPTPVGTNHFS